MESVLWPWLVEIGFITYRDLSQNTPKRPPLPSELLATFVVFGAISGVARANPRAGSLLGWGIVIATALNVFNPQASSPSTLLNPSGKSNVQGNTLSTTEAL